MRVRCRIECKSGATAGRWCLFVGLRHSGPVNANVTTSMHDATVSWRASNNGILCGILRKDSCGFKLAHTPIFAP